MGTSIPSSVQKKYEEEVYGRELYPGEMSGGMSSGSSSSFSGSPSGESSSPAPGFFFFFFFSFFFFFFFSFFLFFFFFFFLFFFLFSFLFCFVLFVFTNHSPLLFPSPSKKIAEQKSHFDEDQNLCVICLDNGREVVFTPCGHLVTCKSCSKLSECPICRSKIDASLTVFY